MKSRDTNLSVIKQMQDLVTNPVCTKTQGQANEVRYETESKVFTATGTKDGLPRPTDVPVIMFVLEAFQAKQNIAKDIAKKTGVIFDPHQHTTVRIVTDDVLVAQGRKVQTNSRKAIMKSLDRYSGTIITIEYKGEAKKKRKRKKKPIRYNFAMITTAEYGTTELDVTITKEYMKVMVGLDKKEIRYLALDHVIHLTGTASQLYSILAEQLGHAKANNEYTIAARTLARKIFGEERGGDKEKLPTSRFYAPYVKNALAEIADKTKWVIGCDKTRRGEDVALTFYTVEIRQDNIERPEDVVPNAFEVARAALAKREQEAIKTEATKVTRKVKVVGETIPDVKPEPTPKHKKANTPKPQSPNVELPASLVAKLEKVKMLGTGIEGILAPIVDTHGEDGAIALIQYAAKKRREGTICGYINGMGDGAMDVAKQGVEGFARQRARQEIMNRRIIEDFVKKQISDGRNNAWIERECKAHDITMAQVEAWMADNKDIVDGWKDKRRADDEAKLEKIRIDEAISEFKEKHQGIELHKVHSAAQDAYRYFRREITVEDVMVDCEKRGIDPNATIEYARIRGW